MKFVTSWSVFLSCWSETNVPRAGPDPQQPLYSHFLRLKVYCRSTGGAFVGAFCWRFLGIIICIILEECIILILFNKPWPFILLIKGAITSQSSRVAAPRLRLMDNKARSRSHLHFSSCVHGFVVFMHRAELFYFDFSFMKSLNWSWRKRLVLFCWPHEKNYINKLNKLCSEKM